MVYTATSVQSPQSDVIREAITTIATEQAGLTFAGSSSGRWPTSLELGETGTPWFMVLLGSLIGYHVAGELQPKGHGHRAMNGQRGPVWTYDLYGIYPFDSKAPVMTPGEDFLKAIEPAFTTYATLNDCPTVAKMQVVDGKAATYPMIGGATYLAATLQLLVFESLETIYAPIPN